MRELGFYYLHVNNSLIYKRMMDENTIDDLIDSDFVKYIWKVDLCNRMNAWDLLVEAFFLGVDEERIYSLAKKWGCDNTDAVEFAKRIGVKIKIAGQDIEVSCPDPNKESEFLIGEGGTRIEAMADLCKKLGCSPSKWEHESFSDLTIKANKKRDRVLGTRN